MIRVQKTFSLLMLTLAAISLAGCASDTNNVNPSTNPSTNPTTQKSRPSFAEYAASRQYPADLPKVDETDLRGEVEYQLDVINFVNFGTKDLSNVEVWVNEHYVTFIGALPVKKQRGVNFHVLFDSAGKRAPSRGVWVEKIELNYDGQMHSVRIHAAD